MTINLPYGFGDPTYRVSNTCEETEGPVLAEVARAGTVKAVKVMPGKEPGSYQTWIQAQDNETWLETGSKGCFLAQGNALDWLEKNMPDAIVLDPMKTVKAFLVEYPEDEGRVIDVELSLDAIGGHVPGVPVATEVDATGHFLVYNKNAKITDYPITRFVRNDKDQVVDAMFGPFLMFRLDGENRIVSIDEEKWNRQSEI